MANSHVLGDNPDLSCLIKAARMRQADSGQPPLEVSFIHQLDVYSASPDVLVAGIEDNGAGRWFFTGIAKYRAVKKGLKPKRNRAAKKGLKPKRNRTVAGTGHGHNSWRAEGGKFDHKKLVDGKIVSFRSLSYVTRTKGFPLARHGWIMREYTLPHQDGADELVLCEVYRSNRNNTSPRKKKKKNRKNMSACPPEEEEPALVAEGVVLVSFGTFGDADVAEEDARVESLVQDTADEINSTEELPSTTKGSSDLFHGLEHPNIAAATGTIHTMCSCAASIGKRPDARILAARSNNLGDNEAPESILTNMAFKSNTTILRIARKGVLEQSDFKEKVLSIINDLGIPPDCMEDRISLNLFLSVEGRISLELFPLKPLLSREMIEQELEKFADVTVLQQRSIISLIGDARQSTLILNKLSSALLKIGVNCPKVECRESEGQVTNITVVVNDSEIISCVHALYSEFFGKSSPVPVNSSSAPAASSGSKRKVANDEDHPDAPPAGRRQTNPQTPCSVLEETDEDDEEVQGADLEFNNSTIPVNSSTTISSEPIHYNHPESPQERMPEQEIQMPNGVQVHQDLNNEPELPTEVMGNPAYETWWPTEDSWAIDLGSDDYRYLEIGPLW